MKIWIVTDDLGDGDVGLSYFPSAEEANAYCNAMVKHADYGCHESNPHEIDTDNMSWTGRYEDVNDVDLDDEEDDE